MMPLRTNKVIHAMQRVDGHYFYQVGSQIHPLAELAAGTTTWSQAHFPVVIAEGALEPLITRTVLQLRTSVQTGAVLLAVVREIKDRILDQNSAPDGQETVDWVLIWRMQTALTAFEAVLAAEMQLIPLYVVTPKGGFVLTDLIENGQVCFPPDLWEKVPEALPDVREATKCIAFELPTAAGFHLHRANEAVIRAYFRVVAEEQEPPKSGNMGDYLKIMAELGAGDPKVIAALTQLKNLHRNPLMHPEQALESVEEAISLMGAVRAAVGEMLKAIPAFPALLGAVNPTLPPPGS